MATAQEIIDENADIGGYPTELFAQEPAEEFKCIICLQVLRNSVQCKSQHPFCKSCIVPSLEQNSSCPTCRSRLTLNKLVPSRIIRNLVSASKIWCPTTLLLSSVNADGDKCTWTGSLNSCAEHLNSCQYLTVECPNEGCSYQCRRMEVSNHRQICLFEAVHCPYDGCSFLTARKDLETHSSQCLFKTIPCPNNCGQMQLFKDLTDHLQYRCIFQQVACPLSGLGCSSQCTGFVRRVDLEAHVGQPGNMLIFLKETLDKLNKQKEEINDLRSTVNLLSEELAMQKQLSIRQGVRIDELEQMNGRLSAGTTDSSASSASSSSVFSVFDVIGKTNNNGSLMAPKVMNTVTDDVAVTRSSMNLTSGGSEGERDKHYFDLSEAISRVCIRLQKQEAEKTEK